MRYHFVKEAVHNVDGTVLYTYSSENHADLFTKAFVGLESAKQYERLRPIGEGCLRVSTSSVVK